MSFFNLNLPETDLNSPSSPTNMSPLSNPEQRVFPCNYCRRKFYSSQALGGHQNAHKIERNLAKKSRESSSMVKPHSGFNNFNQHTSRSSSGGVSHGRQVQPPLIIGTNHHEHVGRFIASDHYSRGVDYGYKGECAEEEFSQLDLSLRL